MRLPFLRSRGPATDRSRAMPGLDEPTAIAVARTRARRRLVGALLLLLIGVIGFPMFFETRPRPLPLDTPILMPQAQSPWVDAPPPIAAGSAPTPVSAAAPVLPPVDAETEAAPASVPRPMPARAVAATATATATPPVPTPRPASAPVRVQAAAPPPPAPASAPDQPPPAAKPPASAPTGSRFIVQAGAFTDAGKLYEARQRVEKLGFKTYTQVIESEAGKRTRVRVGPYATREEADDAAAKLRRAGLAANVLTI